MKHSKIKFLILLAVFSFSTTIQVMAVTVETSKTIASEFSPKNMVDGDLSTKWISDEKENAWGMIDLGNETAISNVWVYFDSRWPKEFDVLFSTDKESWTSVYTKGAKKSINIFKIVQPCPERSSQCPLPKDCMQQTSHSERSRDLRGESERKNAW
jgi:hypothetical protein